MPVEIVYETHATTTDNEAGISTGWLHGELSAQGRREARELGDRRRGEELAVVISSDLDRSVETARLAFPDGRPELRLDPRLRECDYGALNGAPSEVVAARRVHQLDEPFPGGQSYRQVLGVTDAFLRDLARQWDGARVLLIAHTANQWALECLLAGASPRDLLEVPFAWRPGWSYTLPSGWAGRDDLLVPGA